MVIFRTVFSRSFRNNPPQKFLILFAKPVADGGETVTLKGFDKRGERECGRHYIGGACAKIGGVRRFGPNSLRGVRIKRGLLSYKGKTIVNLD